MENPNNIYSNDENNDPELEDWTKMVREVGKEAVWTVSSCKPGNGVNYLVDDKKETYWQSDGQLPHLANIQFRRKTVVCDICIYTDFIQDETYTPSHISVRMGTDFNDLQEIQVVKLNEPRGWLKIITKGINDLPIKTFMLQIAIISNHTSGRDTRIRQIKVHSPIEERQDLFGNFSTVEMKQYTIIR